jgi:hypothetical protein
MNHQLPPRPASLRAIFVPIFLSAIVLMSGCDSSKNVPVAVAAPAKQKALAPSEAKPTGRRFDLTLAGYNYTNRYIDDYRVNGQGGGNLDVSQPGSAGGGSVCCVIYFDTDEKQTVTVRWQSDACYFTTKSTISNDIYRHIHSFYKEVTVQVERSNTRKPNYLEVHFYPDGTVKAVVTETTSSPRMIVDPASEDRSEFPRCPNDKKPL